MQTAQRSVVSAWPGTTELGDSGIARLSGVCGVLALSAMTIVAAVQPEVDDHNATANQAVAGIGATWRDHLLDPARAIGGYGGISYTYPDTVRIKRQDGDVTASDFDWIGQPFKAPIYYGARVWRWNPLGRVGTMVDFTHAKAIANPDTVAKFSGSHSGKPLPATAPVKDVFSKLEFSHGHNMLTYNGLFRLGSLFGWLRPYAGAGAGVSLPHSEIGYAKENVRTYEYHFAGFAGQGLAGLEIDLGQTSLFLEYKFTYAPHDIPLSHEPTGDLLVTDLWRQFNAWWGGEKPPGGRLSVNLVSHHGIAGVMVKTGRPAAVAGP